MSTLAERLATVVEESGLSQTAFADEIGVSQGFVSQVRYGRSNLSPRTAKMIETKFGVSAEWLLTGTGTRQIKFSREDEIAEYVAKILKDENAELQRRIIAAMAKIPADFWPEIEKFARRIVNDEKD